METVNVVAGGPKGLWPTDLRDGKLTGPFIGVDRGGLRLAKMGIEMSAAVGDFDSVSSDEFRQIKKMARRVSKVNAEKDETDTELGIKTANELFKGCQINVYGFSGGRLDHLLTNLLMVLKPTIKPLASQLTLVDNQNVVRFFYPGTHHVERLKGMKYLDFAPLTPMNLTLSDEKYQLDDFSVKFPTSFSSNEFVGNHATFSFDKGLLLVIQSKDG